MVSRKIIVSIILTDLLRMGFDTVLSKTWNAENDRKASQ